MDCASYRPDTKDYIGSSTSWHIYKLDCASYRPDTKDYIGSSTSWHIYKLDCASYRPDTKDYIGSSTSWHIYKLDCAAYRPDTKDYPDHLLLDISISWTVHHTGQILINQHINHLTRTSIFWTHCISQELYSKNSMTLQACFVLLFTIQDYKIHLKTYFFMLFDILWMMLSMTLKQGDPFPWLPRPGKCDITFQVFHDLKETLNLFCVNSCLPRNPLGLTRYNTKMRYNTMMKPTIVITTGERSLTYTTTKYMLIPMITTAKREHTTLLKL